MVTRLSLKLKKQKLICADEEDYLPALVWEEELKKRGYSFELSLKGNIFYDEKELSILSYLQLYKRDKKAPYLQEIKKIITTEIFEKIRLSDQVLFLIPEKRTLSPFLLVQIVFTIVLNIPYLLTNKIDPENQYYEILRILSSKIDKIATLENDFPPLNENSMGENYEM